MRRRKSNPIGQKDLDYLEAQLAGTLRPLQTSQDIVHRLRGRIQFPPREQLVRRLHSWRSLYLALGGVLSGMLLIITIARALYHLVGRRL